MSLNPDLALKDLKSYVAKSSLRITSEAESPFRLSEEIGYRFNFFLQPPFFLYSCLMSIRKLQNLVIQQGGDPTAGASEVLAEIEKTGDKKTNWYDQPKYLYSSAENRNNTRTLLIDLAIASARRHLRSEINELDVLSALLDMHDQLFPPLENSAWADELLQAPYNTLSHIVGKQMNSINVKFDDIRADLGLDQSLSHRKRIEFAPPKVRPALLAFLINNPDYDKNCFLVMSFERTTAHKKIHEELEQTLKKFGLRLLRADDKSYDQDLKINIEAYLHGSKLAIALYERISSDLFNPNVAFEVGYMIGLKKDVCLLKEKTLKYMNTDLIGNLYSEFDVQDIEGTIPVQVERWLKEKEIID